MNDPFLDIRKRWRRRFSAVICTPLHPQWLVRRAQKQRTEWIRHNARGFVLDIGCADSSIRNDLVHSKRYLGLDYPATATEIYGTRPALFADAAFLPLCDAFCDTVMMLDVAEHLPDPGRAIREAYRVLVPEGVLLITIPFAYPLHDQPYDFQRLTKYGLQHALKSAGFASWEIIEIGEGSTSGAAILAISVAQGALRAASQRSWQIVWVPLALPAILLVNLVGWFAGKVLPAFELMPSGYYVRAVRT